MNLEFLSSQYTYYDIEKSKYEEEPRNGLELYRSIWTLSDQELIHTREAYTFLDMIGDVGGFFDGLSLIVMILLSNIISHNM